MSLKLSTYSKELKCQVTNTYYKELSCLSRQVRIVWSLGLSQDKYV